MEQGAEWTRLWSGKGAAVGTDIKGREAGSQWG